MGRISDMRAHLDFSHGALEQMVADLDGERAHAIPPGRAHPIAERYAHLVVSEDTLVNAVAKGGAALHATTWSGRTGLSDTNLMQADFARARALRVDLPKLRMYAAAVYRSTDDHVASLDEAALARIVDLTAFGQGTYPLGAFLQIFVVGHVDAIMGELAVLRGIQGLRGYPF